MAADTKDELRLCRLNGILSLETRVGRQGSGRHLTRAMGHRYKDLAKTCFEGISPRDRFLVPKDDKHEEHFKWVVTLPPAYLLKSRDTVELELSKAADRLAALLKAVWPETN